LKSQIVISGLTGCLLGVEASTFPSVHELAARHAGSRLAPAPGLGGFCREPRAVRAA
jgi:hypothetical protein